MSRILTVVIQLTLGLLMIPAHSYGADLSNISEQLTRSKLCQKLLGSSHLLNAGRSQYLGAELITDNDVLQLSSMSQGYFQSAIQPTDFGSYDAKTFQLQTNQIAWSKISYEKFVIGLESTKKSINLAAFFRNSGSKQLNPDVDHRNHHAFVIAMARPQAGQHVKIHLRTYRSNELAKELKKDIWLEAALNYESVQDFDWASVKLSDFKFNTEVTDTAIEAINYDDIISHLGFEIVSPQTEDSALTLIPEIEATYSWNTDRLSVSELLPKLFSYLGFDRIRTTGHWKYDDWTYDIVAQAYDDFFKSARSIENQKYAAAVIQQGPEAIEAELNKYDMTLEDINTNQNRVVSATLSGHVNLPLIVSIIVRNGRLPLEAGEFAKLHGGYAHVAQFIAGLKGLSNEQVEIFNAFLRLIIAGPEQYWTLWNLFFDSRDYDVSGVRIWRDLNDSNI